MAGFFSLSFSIKDLLCALDRAGFCQPMAEIGSAWALRSLPAHPFCDSMTVDKDCRHLSN